MEDKVKYITEAPLSIAEERATYVRSDGSTFTREDIYVKLYVTFRDEMLAALKGPPLSVYLCIALHCGKEGMTAYPSIATICEETGYSNRAVITAAQKLQGMGLIEAVGVHKSGSHIYRVRGYASMGEQRPYEPSSQLPVNLVHRTCEPSSHKEDPIEDPIEEEIPAAPGLSPSEEEMVEAEGSAGIQEEEEIAEIEAMFNKTGTARLSKEEFLRRHDGIAVVTGREARGADVPGEIWSSEPVRQWCTLAGKSFEAMSIATRLKLGGIFYKIGCVTNSTPAELAEAIGKFQAEHPWWKYRFDWPSDAFCDRLGMMLVPDDPNVSQRVEEAEYEQPMYVEYVEEPDWMKAPE